MTESPSTSLTEFVSRYSSRRKSRGIARLREVGLLRIFEGFRLSAFSEEDVCFYTLSTYDESFPQTAFTRGRYSR